MSFFNFDDKRIQHVFNRIASIDNKSNKIDSEQEENALADLLSGCLNSDGNVSEHDIALLRSGALNFDNRKIKKQYKAFAKADNKNREIDTKNERDLAKEYLEKNRDNMSFQDISIWQNMVGADTVVQQENPHTVIKIKADVAEGAVLQIAIGNNLTNIIEEGDGDSELEDTENLDDEVVALRQDVQPTDDKAEAKVPLENTDKEKVSSGSVEQKAQPVEVVQPEIQTREYKIQGGDYWYKMVQENYGISAHNEVMQVVRKLKQEYFEANKSKLIQQGYTSPRAGFFPKAGEILNLPLVVQIDGKSVELK